MMLRFTVHTLVVRLSVLMQLVQAMRRLLSVQVTQHLVAIGLLTPLAQSGMMQQLQAKQALPMVLHKLATSITSVQRLCLRMMQQFTAHTLVVRLFVLMQQAQAMQQLLSVQATQQLVAIGLLTHLA
jgi:hypothetical protein